MKTLITLIVMLFSIQPIPTQFDKNPVIILISSSSTPDYIGEMRDYLELYGFVLNVEKELWAEYDQLQEFAFTLTDVKTKRPMSFHFKYNDLNKHQIFMVYPLDSGEYGSVMTDISYLRSELLGLLMNREAMRKKPILHRSYAKSGAPYRESIVRSDLDHLETELEESISLYKTIRADQVLRKSISGFAYTYNGEYIEDPAGINLLDMSADVLIEDLEEDGKIINIWSDAPLDRLITGSTIAGER